MQQINLHRGLDVPFDGQATLALAECATTAVYHIVPDHYAGIKPKLLVKEGDIVKVGSPLFADKKAEQMLFTAPVSGKVVGIVRGERRKVLSIDIEAAQTMEYKQFDLKKEVKELLLESGLWTLIKQRPYDCIAMPSKEPKAIFVSSFDSAPAAADYQWVLKDKVAEVEKAIEKLGAIAPVYVGLDGKVSNNIFANLKGCELYTVNGPHPAGNVGVQINHIAALAKGETVWTINIQDLAIIGRFFEKGEVDMHKTVALTGPMVAKPIYYTVLPGMAVADVIGNNVISKEDVRYVAGNPLSGHQIGLDEMVSPYDNQYTVLEEGSNTHEFMGWLLPRFKDFNASCTDPAKPLQKLFGVKKYRWDARLKGGRRAIIVSGEYDKVFPMDIYPEYLIKAMIAGNLERMEQLGAYEVAPEDFALCEYVCTSKMPLQAIVRAALDNLKNEVE